MRITGVQIHQFEWERGPYHWRDEIMPAGVTARSGLLCIETDAGITGLSPYAGGASIAEIKHQLLGQDPLDRERLWQRLWRNLRTSNLGLAIGPIDVALHDLLGKVAGLPCHKLLGAAKDRVQTYASTVTLDSMDEYLALADECLALGYRAIKLHAWGRLQEDAHLCKTLRRHVGDEITLMYDASSMFTQFSDAVWFGHQLEEAGFLWYEEPADHYNLTFLKRLAGELDIPLALAEATHGGPFDALTHLQSGAAGVILTGPLDAYKGGFTGVLKTAHLCEGFGVTCAMHGGSISCLHAACALFNSPWFERLVPAHYYSPPGIRDASTEIGADGYATPWDEPGLGLQVDWDWIKAHTVRVEG